MATLLLLIFLALSTSVFTVLYTIEKTRREEAQQCLVHEIQAERELAKSLEQEHLINVKHANRVVMIKVPIEENNNTDISQKRKRYNISMRFADEIAEYITITDNSASLTLLKN